MGHCKLSTGTLDQYGQLMWMNAGLHAFLLMNCDSVNIIFCKPLGAIFNLLCHTFLVPKPWSISWTCLVDDLCCRVFLSLKSSVVMNKPARKLWKYFQVRGILFSGNSFPGLIWFSMMCNNQLHWLTENRVKASRSKHFILSNVVNHVLLIIKSKSGHTGAVYLKYLTKCCLGSPFLTNFL